MRCCITFRAITSSRCGSCGHLRGGPDGLWVPPLDSAGRRFTFAGIGICQADDNIIGSPVSGGDQDGNAGDPGDDDTFVVGIGSTLLVLKQPDLGTSLTYIAILMVGAFLAGLRRKYVVVIAVVTMLVLPVGWYFLKDFQRARLVSFLDPDRDPRSRVSIDSIPDRGRSGWDVRQGSYQGNADPVTLPSGIAEGLHLCVSCRRAWICRRSDCFVAVLCDDYAYCPECANGARSGGYVYLHGVASLLLFHVLVNVGMVAGLMPVTGIPLPFFSAGGSSIWSSFLALGLVNNVRLRRFVN